VQQVEQGTLLGFVVEVATPFVQAVEQSLVDQ
jgi:hypothetical protein